MTLTAPPDIFLFPARLCLLLVREFSPQAVFGDHTRAVELLAVWVTVTIGLPLAVTSTARPMFQLRYLIVASSAYVSFRARVRPCRSGRSVTFSSLSGSWAQLFRC